MTTEERLTTISLRLEAMDEKFSAQLDNMAIIIVKGFDSIDHELQQKADKTDIRRVMDALDGLLKRQEISDEERLVMGHQLDRLDKWTHELAQKIGHKLAT